MDSSSAATVIFGNGFIGNFLAWASPNKKTFAFNSYESFKDLPKDLTYNIVFCHGKSRGPDLQNSQVKSLANAISEINASGIQVSQAILISSLWAESTSEFGVAKRVCEDLIQNILHDCKKISLRLANVYGTFKAQKSNSIVSQWLFDSDPEIKADNSQRFFVSLSDLSNIVFNEAPKLQSGTYNVISKNSTKVRDLGFAIHKELSKFDVHKIFTQIESSSNLELSNKIQTITTDSNILDNIESVVGLSLEANRIFTAVSKKQRTFMHSAEPHFLLDLSLNEYKNLERVYTFNVLPGSKRGRHFHKLQKEVFSSVKGCCEILIEKENGLSVSVPLSQFDELTVHPLEQHTLWVPNPNSECIILTSSTLGYVDNATPDVYRL